MEKLTRGFVPGLFWAIVILLLTGLPGSVFPRVVTFWDWLTPDKIVHVIIFGIFTFLMIWGYRAQYLMNQHRLKYLLTTIVIGVLFGALTEYLQKVLFVGRCGNIFDFCADVVGCVLGLIVFWAFYRKKIHKIIH